MSDIHDDNLNEPLSPGIHSDDVEDHIPDHHNHSSDDSRS